MHLARALPLLSAAVIIYIMLVAFSAPDAANTTPFLDRYFEVPLPSATKWRVHNRDWLLLLALALFCVEIIKSSFSGTASMIDHILSLGLSVICLLMFLLVPRCATSTFFFLMVLSMIDVVAGYVIAVRVARRDLQIGTS